MPKKKAVKKIENKIETTVLKKEKRVPKIMTVNNITDNQPETIEPSTQEVEGKTWVKTTSKRRHLDVK